MAEYISSKAMRAQAVAARKATKALLPPRRKRIKYEKLPNEGTLVWPVRLTGQLAGNFPVPAAVKANRHVKNETEEMAENKDRNLRFTDRWSIVEHLANGMLGEDDRREVEHPYPMMRALQRWFYLSTGIECRRMSLVESEPEAGRIVNPCRHPACPACWYSRMRKILEAVDLYALRHRSQVWFLRKTAEVWVDGTFDQVRTGKVLTRASGLLMAREHEVMFNTKYLDHQFVGRTIYADRDGRLNGDRIEEQACWGLVGVWAGHKIPKARGYYSSRPDEIPWRRPQSKLTKEGECITVETELYQNRDDLAAGLLRAIPTPDKCSLPREGQTLGKIDINEGSELEHMTSVYVSPGQTVRVFDRYNFR